MSQIEFRQRQQCAECGSSKTCRFSGARWICLGCWPKVFDGTIRTETHTMGPGRVREASSREMADSHSEAVMRKFLSEDRA